MIEATTLPGAALAKTGEKPSQQEIDASGFSFSAAMIALEGRAAQSLETFGATPKGSAPIAAPTAEAQTAAREQKGSIDPNGADKKTAGATLAKADLPAKQQALQVQPQASQPQTATTLRQQAQPLPLVSAAPQAISQQAQAPAVRTEAGAIRTAEALKADTLKAQRPVMTNKAPPAPQEFAKLIAHRLKEGATSFELRLDPPELGRVEAHLKISDDGKNVLALKFEHQATLDYFARDEAALRAALTSSGFDLGQQQLAFSLSREETAPSSPPSAIAFAINETYEPIFLAPFSEGAVDLRV